MFDRVVSCWDIVFGNFLVLCVIVVYHDSVSLDEVRHDQNEDYERKDGAQASLMFALTFNLEAYSLAKRVEYFCRVCDALGEAPQPLDWFTHISTNFLLLFIYNSI